MQFYRYYIELNFIPHFWEEKQLQGVYFASLDNSIMRIL